MLRALTAWGLPVERHHQPCTGIDEVIAFCDKWADGRQALETMCGEPFGGVLLDIGIGQIDGLEVLRHIRQWHPQIPVIMITASGSRELAVRAMGMGAQAYLLKPFQEAMLDVLSGQADFVCDPGIAFPHIRSNKVKLLGVMYGIGIAVAAAVALLLLTVLFDYLFNLPAWPRFVLAVAGPWMLSTLVEYLQRTLQSIPSVVG